ncbi:hypothetical protein [Pseudonocardia xishanensis]|uniref:Uncharacterized protein n=1 Tax=Pseudonocardia xishanensis TaxID=630995 RepID=A0ABP8S0E3_9PSEU
MDTNDCVTSGRPPTDPTARSRTFTINEAWLTVVLLAVDLLSATQHLLDPGEGAALTSGDSGGEGSWPWAEQLAAALARLHTLPVPVG